MTLPPCPWCGDEPTDPDDDRDWYGIGYVEIRCASCGERVSVSRQELYVVQKVEA